MRPETAVPDRRPLFRVEHVGPLIRPERLRRARADREAGRIGPEDLREVEDAAVQSAVRMQADIGVQAVTDGGFRRVHGLRDFAAALTGARLVAGDGGAPPRIALDEPPGFPPDHPVLDEFRALAAVARTVAKVSIPGFSLIRPQDCDPALDELRDPDGLAAALSEVWRAAVGALHAAGCRHLQIEDDFPPSSPGLQADARRRADEDARGLRRWAEALVAVVAARPPDMTIALRLTRGGAALDPAAREAAFAVGADVCFVNLDGDLGWLSAAPAGTRVMLGAISAEAPALERLEDLKRAFDAASRVVDLGRLGLALRGGFADDGLLTEDDQKRKLDLAVGAAEAIWGAVDA
jgi:5-methyltetrahydropteroyltriglutamate--homocysteine methyltransferase